MLKRFFRRTLVIITFILIIGACVACACKTERKEDKTENNETIETESNTEDITNKETGYEQESKLNKVDAREIVMGILPIYENFCYYGVTCDMGENIKDVDKEVFSAFPEELRQQLNCCIIKELKNVSEVKEHVTKYISKEHIEEYYNCEFDEYMSGLDKSCVLIEEQLCYIYSGAKGRLNFAEETCQIKECDNEKIVAECMIYDPYGGLAVEYKIDLIKVDDRFVIRKAEYIK